MPLRVSDYTRGIPDRLGINGAVRAVALPDKVEQTIRCPLSVPP